jgi:ABC-type tungstate transport system substrate-binding protein
MTRFLPGFPFLFFATNLLAQDATPADDAAATAAAGLLAGACGCIIPLVALAIQIAIAVWVYKDAKARGMDNAVLLTVLTVFTGLIGLLIYLLMRPKGNLVACASCGKKRLEGSTKCPNCGNS